MRNFVNETNDIAANIMEPLSEAKSEAEGDSKSAEIIKELIDTSWGGSNDEQGKAVQLLKGLAFSDDPASNKFMKKLDAFTSGLKADEF